MKKKIKEKDIVQEDLDSELLNEFITMYKESNTNEILLDLMDGSHNLELKTEIRNPLITTFMTIYAETMEKYGLKEPASIIKLLLETLFSHMISNNRKGRSEIFNTISAIEVNKQITTSDVLTKNLNKL